MFRYFVAATLLAISLTTSAQRVSADDGPDNDNATERQAGPDQVSDRPQSPAGGDEAAPANEFKLNKDVEAALLPLFRSIASADVSRATVELSAETLKNGAVVDRQKSSYQIASIHPDQFTVYLKQPEQRTRVYCNGKDFVVAMAPDAFFRLPEPMDLFNAVFDMPVPMGPYPEVVFALTFAGADPALTMLGGMESVEIVDRGKFRGKVPAIHIKGVQDDGVVWDFWITQGKQPKPLRLLVDLTEMLRDNAQMQMQPGVTYELRFDFLTWRMSGAVDKKLFQYNPPADAVEYESLDDYYKKIADVTSQHPLLGKPAPPLSASLLNGRKVTPKVLEGKTVVVDFWATWCTPCAEAMPVMKKVCDAYADKDVVLLSVNIGEEKEKVAEFVKKQGWKLNVLLDQEMKLAKAYTADVIPLRMVISKTGVVESIHFGYPGADALEQRLNDELEVLTAGGKIATSDPAKKPAEKPKK
ncbi:MAG: redoxin domain-containing protein [Pirellulaceae bacterium]|nr:redoxin domain-containing protein [Pirellulaceae bacterium]